MPFAALGLIPELTRALAERNYSQPTAVQSQVIPEILAGRDILAGAQTGTGKTAGFTLPILQLLHAGKRSSPAPRALILVPTRELASQVGESIKSYGRYLGVKTLVIFGGVGINPQIEALRRGCDVLVATPGRLLDHAQQRTVDLGRVEILVLDEADRMLDMGFIADIRRVMRLLPPRRQNLLFSATYSNEIRQLAQSLLQTPVEVEVVRRSVTADNVEQQIYAVPKDLKRALLSHLIRSHSWSQVLIFTRTKHGADRLTRQLLHDGIHAAAIHGNKSQSARTRALGDFKTGNVQALVATEVASRGLDIKELPHVVNFELPNVPEDYVHRVGRTGRAGASGFAVSLVSPDERSLLTDIEKVLRRRLPTTPLPDFDTNVAELPSKSRHSESHNGQQRRSDDMRKRREPRQHSATPARARTADQRTAHGKTRNAHSSSAPGSSRHQQRRRPR